MENLCKQDQKTVKSYIEKLISSIEDIESIFYELDEQFDRLHREDDNLENIPVNAIGHLIKSEHAYEQAKACRLMTLSMGTSQLQETNLCILPKKLLDESLVVQIECRITMTHIFIHGNTRLLKGNLLDFMRKTLTFMSKRYGAAKNEMLLSRADIYLLRLIVFRCDEYWMAKNILNDYLIKSLEAYIRSHSDFSYDLVLEFINLLLVCYEKLIPSERSDPRDFYPAFGSLIWIIIFGRFVEEAPLHLLMKRLLDSSDFVEYIPLLETLCEHSDKFFSDYDQASYRMNILKTLHRSIKEPYNIRHLKLLYEFWLSVIRFSYSEESKLRNAILISIAVNPYGDRAYYSKNLHKGMLAEYCEIFYEMETNSNIKQFNRIKEYNLIIKRDQSKSFHEHRSGLINLCDIVRFVQEPQENRLIYYSIIKTILGLCQRLFMSYKLRCQDETTGILLESEIDCLPTCAELAFSTELDDPRNGRFYQCEFALFRYTMKYVKRKRREVYDELLSWLDEIQTEQLNFFIYRYLPDGYYSKFKVINEALFQCIGHRYLHDNNSSHVIDDPIFIYCPLMERMGYRSSDNSRSNPVPATKTSLDRLTFL